MPNLKMQAQAGARENGVGSVELFAKDREGTGPVSRTEWSYRHPQLPVCHLDIGVTTQR